MEFREIKTPQKNIVNTGGRPVVPGRVERAVWHIPDVRTIRFLRFGFDMPGEPVFFGRMDEKSPEAESVSLLMLKSPEDGEMVLCGFRSYEWSDGRFVLRPAPQGGFEVTAVADYDGFTLDPGEEAGADDIVVLKGTGYNELLEEWAKICARSMGCRVPDHIPTGWNDWQFYRNDKTQEDILANCDALKELK